MPEEKVSTGSDNLTSDEYGCNCGVGNFDPVAHVADCPLKTQAPTVNPYAPAADAGPRQHCQCTGHRHVIGADGCMFAVPQEAAPRECDCEECASRLATAPDWAMRLAEQIVPSVHENYAFDDTLPEREAVYAHVAARIREAGSERERALTDLLTRLVAKLKIILPKVDGIIGLQSMRAGHDIYNGPNLKDELAEASRLLGGETK